MLIFAVLSATVLLFCCVPMVMIQIAFGPEVTKVPAEVLAVAQKIAPVIVPPRFSGTVARSADNSVLQLHVARFDHTDGRGRLVIGQVHLKALPDYDANLLQNLTNELFPGQRLLDVKQTRTKLITIRGQEEKIEILEGEDRASTTRYKQVSAAFDGSDGAKVQLLLQAESDFVTDEAIDALLQSLATPTAEATP